MADTVTTDRRGRTLVVACHGDLDLAARDDLRAGLRHVVPAADRITDDLAVAHVTVVVDLSGVTFMDCAALSVFIALGRGCHVAGVPLVLAGAAPIVLRLLTTLDLHRQFVLTSTVDEGVALAEAWSEVGGPADYCDRPPPPHLPRSVEPAQAPWTDH
jgi:anti-sigma B factor antagonist